MTFWFGLLSWCTMLRMATDDTSDLSPGDEIVKLTIAATMGTEFPDAVADTPENREHFRVLGEQIAEARAKKVDNFFVDIPSLP